MLAPEVVSLLKARAETLRDAYDLVRQADPAVFGGTTRHRHLQLQAKATWLAARIALAEALADGRAPC